MNKRISTFLMGLMIMVLVLTVFFSSCSNGSVEQTGTSDSNTATETGENNNSENPNSTTPGTPTGNGQSGEIEVDLPVNRDIKGTVRYAVRDTVAYQTDELIEYFNIMYPNIKVELEEFSGDLNTALTNWAAAKKMPDVVLGWDNLSYFAVQGWLYPLDEFLNKDAEKQYINKTSLDNFMYEGKTYAVPAWLQFSTIVVNLDLVDALNMDPPDYDWTIDEFVRMAKKASTTTYSGINHIESLDEKLMQQLLKKEHQWGYDPATKKFNLTDGSFTEAVKITDDLLKYPQLVADALRNNDIVSSGGQDDYAKKFGSQTDGLSGGKILFANQSTWDDEWMYQQFKFKWDYYPIPAKTKGDSKQVVHADYGIMLSSAKDPAAAFELLKFFTYGKDGLLVRMEQQSKKNYQNNRFTIPPSSHPEVYEKFNSSSKVPDGVKYMYNNMEKSVKGDFSKILPDYWAAINDPLYDSRQRIGKGEDAASVAKETEKKINENFSDAYKKFVADFKKVQK